MPTHRTRTSALVQARMPLALIAQAEALATHLGCTVSDLLREGLTLRLASDRSPGTVPDTTTVELSGAVRQAIAHEVQEAVETALRAAGHVQPVRETERVRRARRDVPPPESLSGVSYDPTKFYLATLCKRGHDWAGTGQSLLRRGNGNCVQCQRELRRAREARH